MAMLSSESSQDSERTALHDEEQQGLLNIRSWGTNRFSPSIKHRFQYIDLFGFRSIWLLCIFFIFIAGILIGLVLARSEPSCVADTEISATEHISSPTNDLSIPRPPRPPRRSYHCGTTIAEAHHLNCQFDIMSFSWLPLDCFDSELSLEFSNLRPWSWYRDPEGHDEVPEEEVRAGEHAELHVSWEYHLLHCTYMWRKMHRAVMAKKPVDTYIGNYEHTKHCEKMLLTERDLNSTRTLIKTKFPICPLKARNGN